MHLFYLCFISALILREGRTSDVQEGTTSDGGMLVNCSGVLSDERAFLIVIQLLTAGAFIVENHHI
jgi:hypothetical protein